MLPVQAQLLRIAEPERCELDGDLTDDTLLRAGAVELAVMHTPGHTPGSVSFYVDHGGERIAFTGDTLFRRSIGRTDLWLGDSELILRSVHQRLMTLPPETRVVAGHGPMTTIGEERTHNPFLRNRAI
jgi:hydroxyacylglutathione hydrolase